VASGVAANISTADARLVAATTLLNWRLDVIMVITSID
jgi:hypothetical protein